MYQSSSGGSTYIHRQARLVGKSTPRLAKIIGYHYAHTSAKEVQGSVALSHGLVLNASYIQDLCASLSAICEDKQAKWSYALPPDIISQTVSIAFSRDGTTTRIKGGGYRETMCGSLSCYNTEGERLYSVYIGQGPEHKKQAFNTQFALEIAAIKAKIPHATYLGLADGASDGWAFLEPQTDVRILDYYHASGYLSDFSKAHFSDTSQAKEWFEKQKKILKEQKGGVKKNLGEMNKLWKKMPQGTAKEECHKSITYFKNNQHRMDYAQYQKKGYPIGSGVIEAACKTLIKQRLSRSGMIWTIEGVNKILAIRQVVLSEDRWGQFWQKIDRYGI